ncbi:MAG: hypothetical protein RLZZ347_609 [Candidatus Parcubacteria bacterium]|jgi:hypothetical protein
MSSKTIIGIVVVVVLIVLGVYLSGKKPAVAPTPSMSGATAVSGTPVPPKNSSSDAIIDYVVDGLSADDASTTKATIDGAKAPSQVNTAGSLNTNF